MTERVTKSARVLCPVRTWPYIVLPFPLANVLISRVSCLLTFTWTCLR